MSTDNPHSTTMPFFSCYIGDNHGRQIGKYDTKNARFASQVPGSTGAKCGRNQKTSSESQWLDWKR